MPYQKLWTHQQWTGQCTGLGGRSHGCPVTWPTATFPGEPLLPPSGRRVTAHSLVLMVTFLSPSNPCFLKQAALIIVHLPLNPFNGHYFSYNQTHGSVKISRVFASMLYRDTETSLTAAPGHLPAVAARPGRRDPTAREAAAFPPCSTHPVSPPPWQVHLHRLPRSVCQPMAMASAQLRLLRLCAHHLLPASTCSPTMFQLTGFSSGGLQVTSLHCSSHFQYRFLNNVVTCSRVFFALSLIGSRLSAEEGAAQVTDTLGGRRKCHKSQRHA